MQGFHGSEQKAAGILLGCALLHKGFKNANSLQACSRRVAPHFASRRTCRGSIACRYAPVYRIKRGWAHGFPANHHAFRGRSRWGTPCVTCTGASSHSRPRLRSTASSHRRPRHQFSSSCRASRRAHCDRARRKRGKRKIRAWETARVLRWFLLSASLLLY